MIAAIAMLGVLFCIILLVVVLGNINDTQEDKYDDHESM